MYDVSYEQLTVSNQTVSKAIDDFCKFCFKLDKADADIL